MSKLMTYTGLRGKYENTNNIYSYGRTCTLLFFRTGSERQMLGDVCQVKFCDFRCDFLLLMDVNK